MRKHNTITMLYTRKGDDGTTKAFDSGKGERMSKSSARMEALGSLDELNSFLGYAKVLAMKDSKDDSKHDSKNNDGKVIRDSILWVQNCLFSIQAEVAGAGNKLENDAVTKLETLTEAAEQGLPPIKTFFIPGNSELGAFLDICRAISRRAERRVIAFGEEGLVTNAANPLISKNSLAFLNRLSSFLYALIRKVNKDEGAEEKAPWYNSGTK